MSRGVVHAQKKEYDKALSDYREQVRLHPDDTGTIVTLVWFLATCPKDGLRDGKNALELITKACEGVTPEKPYYPGYIGGLAAAHAECGNFVEAVKWQKKAIEAGIDDKPELEKARARLKLYEAGKPYRSE